MNSHSAPPWSTTELLMNKNGSWQQVDEKTLVGEHVSASLTLVLARIAGLRPQFGHSLFSGVLHRTLGTALVGDEIRPLPREHYEGEARSLESAEGVLAKALRHYGARGAVESVLPVDPMIIRYLNSITSQRKALSPEEVPVVVVDARGVRDLLGATENESQDATDDSSYGLLQRLFKRKQAPQRQHDPGLPDAEPEVVLDPQWLTPDAIHAIDVTQIVSLTSWQEAVRDLPARVSQLMWTAAEDAAISPLAPYRPAQDPAVVNAFSQVPYDQRAITLPGGIRTHDAALCQRYGRDPVDDHAAARLQAVRDAASAWPAWQEELADGTLAARGCIDADGMTRIGKDPFLRQKYAYSIKRTVETERWVTSWLEAGGLLTD